MPLDVTDQEAMHRSVEDVVQGHFGKQGLDILILNAGKSQRLPAVKTDLQMTRDLMKLNFDSLVDMTLQVMKVDKWAEKEKVSKIRARTRYATRSHARSRRVTSSSRAASPASSLSR